MTLSLILRFNLRLKGYSIWSASTSHHKWPRFWGLSTSQPRRNQKYLEDHSKYSRRRSRSTRQMFRSLEVLKDVSVRTRCLQDLATKSSGLVSPGAAGLLIGIECSRIRNSSWLYLTFVVTTRIGVELAVSQGKLPDLVRVGLQQHSARTFNVTLSP